MTAGQLPAWDPRKGSAGATGWVMGVVTWPGPSCSVTASVMELTRFGGTSTLGFAVKIEVTIDDIDVVTHQSYVLSGTALLQTSTAVGGMTFSDADVTSDLATTQSEKYQTRSR